ncbi:MAG TPA: hypothetical protein VM600_08860 [Actinomycetota bacterium]|nr:hypothetical protein [Actinomycetota bacterium]
MKRMSLMAAAVALAAPLFATQPSSAHAEWSIAGFQYFALEAGSSPTTGYVSNPTGPIPVGESHRNDGMGMIVNRDPVTHTFSHCTADCDKTVAKSDETAKFHASLEANTSNNVLAAELDALPNGTYIVMCRVHPWMRASITLSR